MVQEVKEALDRLCRYGEHADDDQDVRRDLLEMFLVYNGWMTLLVGDLGEGPPLDQMIRWVDGRYRNAFSAWVDRRILLKVETDRIARESFATPPDTPIGLVLDDEDRLLLRRALGEYRNNHNYRYVDGGNGVVNQPLLDRVTSLIARLGLSEEPV